MDEILNRQMPHSSEAERSVIGSMLIDSRCVSDVVSILKPDDFYFETNKEIFETIYTMFNYSMVIDPVTVLEQMKIHEVYDEKTSSDYIMELMTVTPTAANVMEYAKILRDKSLLRNIAETGSSISDMAYSEAGTADEVLESAEKKIYSLRRDRNIGGLEPVSKVLLTVYRQINDAAANGSNITGLSTGLSDIDRIIMGLNKSDLILIASRPGMGKTSIALNIALHVAKSSGKTVAIFSLEMSKEQLAMRLLSSESFVDSKKLQTGRLNNEDWRKILAAATSISSTDMRIDDDNSLSVADMNAQCRRLDNLGLVVIDYLQLMQSADSSSSRNRENRQQIVSDISRMLKIMAKELDVPVICLSQLSRASETRQDKRPVLSDLRESGAIEQDADIVIGLYRESYYNRETENPNLAECIILKNRHGEIGSVELQWIPEFTTYTSVDRRHSDEDVF